MQVRLTDMPAKAVEDMFVQMTASLLVLALCIASADEFAPREYVDVSGLPADMRMVRDRWLDLQTLRAARPELGSVEKAAASITSAARTLMARQITDPNHPMVGSFGEIDGLRHRHICYDGGYYGKPLALARAWACPHSPLYHDGKVAEALNAALEFGARFFLVGGERPNNWWAWDIGTPSQVNAALLLAGEAVSPELRKHYMETLYWQGNNPVGLGFDKIGTGANAIWIGANAFRLALLSGDEALMKRGSDIFGRIARLEGPKGDGIMPDGSFHQHGNGINMGYGAAMLRDVTEYMYLTAGTAYELPAQSIDAMVRFFRDYAVWDSYKSKFNPYSSGRAATRPGAYASSAAAGAAVFFLHAGVADARDAALATLHDYACGDLDRIAHVVPALSQSLSGHMDDVAGSGVVTGVRAFPYSDMIISRSAEHFVSVRLAGDTKGWFSIAEENLMAQQVGEGSVVVMTDGRELEADTQYNRPWDRLMGVTRVQGLSRKRETVAQSALIGCASTTNSGVIAADYLLEEGDRRLSGRKSYMLFGNMLVMLGSGLRSSLEAPVGTTLLAVPIRDTDEGAELYHRGVGLVAMEGEVEPRRETLKIKDTAVNKLNGRGNEFSNEWLLVTADSAADETHEYAALVLVGVDQQKHQDALKEAPVTVTRRSDVHSATLLDGSAGALVAFEPGECEAGGLTAPGAVVWERKDGRIEITLSQRNAEAGAVRLTLPVELSDVSTGKIITSEAGRTTLELDVPGGYIVEVRISATVGQ